MKLPLALTICLALVAALSLNVEGANYEETVVATTTYASSGTAQREHRQPVRNLAKASCNLIKGTVRVITTRPARTTHSCR